MPCDHTYTELLDLGGVKLGDFECRAALGTVSGEEYADQHHLAFLRRGAFEKQVGRRVTPVTPNCAVRYRRGEAHRTHHPIAGGDACTVISLDDATIEAVSASLGADYERIPVELDAWPTPGALHLQQWRVYRFAHSKGGDPLELEESLLELAGALVEAGISVAGREKPRVRSSTERAHRALAREAAAFVSARFTEPLSLADVAEAVHSSPFHLARVFRREVGMPAHQFVRGLRLREAMHRLAQGADDTTELALSLGFSSRGHFSDAFRREFGAPPSHVRSMLSAR